MIIPMYFAKIAGWTIWLSNALSVEYLSLINTWNKDVIKEQLFEKQF